MTTAMPELQRAEGAGGEAPNIGHLVRDIGHLLGFIASGRCEWKLDGEPYKRSLTAFGKMIGRTDDRYLQRLWELALGGGLIQQLGTPGVQSTTPYGVASVGKASPKEVFHRAILGYCSLHQVQLDRTGSFYVLENPEYRLLALVQYMPADEWLTAESLRAWLQFRWPVTFKPSLVGLPGEPINPFGGVADLLFAQARTANELTAVMIPSASYDALDPDLSRPSTALPAWEHSWVTQPDRTIVAPPNLHLDALTELWKIATLESNHGAAVFRLSTQSVAAALNLGLTPKRIREILTDHTKGPLPSTVERLIDDQSARYGRIKVGAATTFVKTDEPELLDELKRNPKLKDLRWIDVAPGVAFVQGNSPDDVITALRKAGQLPVRAEAEKKAARRPAGKPALEVVSSRPLAPKEIRRLVRQAVAEERAILVTHGPPGRQKTDELYPIDLHPNQLHAERLDNGRDVEIDFATTISIELGDGDSDNDAYDTADPTQDAELIEALSRMLRLGPGRTRRRK